MKWNLKQCNPLIAHRYHQQLNIDNILAEILINRNISLNNAQKILNSPTSLLEDTLKIHGTYKVATVLQKFLERKDEVDFYIFADYDVDGLCAGYIMLNFLQNVICSRGQAQTHHVYIHYPSRQEGYGLSQSFCNKLIKDKKDNPDKNIVVITVDNGITKVDEVASLIENNISVIITDHHEAKNILPKPTAICSAFYDSNNKTGQHLCGAAIAWKVCQATVLKMSLQRFSLEHYYPYVALATLSDVMPLNNLENLAFVRLGLDKLNSSYNNNLRTLLSHLDIRRQVNYKDLSWNIAPKLNSCGRMDNIELAAYFMLETDETELNNICLEILELDEERKQVVRQAEKDISKHDYSKDNVIIFDSSKYEEGIAGIIAGKLIEKYNKPAIVVHKKENSDIYKGSVRSISGINIFTALTANKKVNSNLVECGGHAEAAGLSFKKENLNNLQQSLNEVVQINIEEVEPTIDIDGYISFKDINNNTLNSINTLAYDKDNFKVPTFLIRNVEVISTKLSSNNPNNICFTLRNDDITLNIWGWKLAKKYQELNSPKELDIIGTLDYGFGSTANKAVFVITDFKRKEVA